MPSRTSNFVYCSYRKLVSCKKSDEYIYLDGIIHISNNEFFECIENEFSFLSLLLRLIRKMTIVFHRGIIFFAKYTEYFTNDCTGFQSKCGTFWWVWISARKTSWLYSFEIYRSGLRNAYLLFCILSINMYIKFSKSQNFLGFYHEYYSKKVNWNQCYSSHYLFDNWSRTSSSSSHY